MAAFNFPNSPSTNDTHTENGVTYKWNGTVWKRQNASYTDATNLNISGISTFGGVSTFTGDATFSGNVAIGKTLTYEDVKNVDSVGVITARGGIHIDDSIVHIGDTNTKIRFPSADTISFETAGSERLNIASNGDVTITNTSSNPQLALISANDGISEIQFGDGNDSVRGNIVYRSGSAGDALCFNGYNNTERLRIPSTGGITVQQGNSNYPTTFIGGSSGGRNFVSVKAGNTTSGHNSGFKLYHSDGNGVISMFINHYDDHGHIMNEHQGGDILFYTNQSGSALEKLRINSSGYVGVKRSSPLANLHVTNNELAIGANPTSAAAPNATYDGLVVDGEAGTFINIRSRGDGNSAYGRVAFSDDVRGRGYLQYNHDDGAGDDVMLIATAGAERLRIDSGGRILIGSTQLLDATAGTIHIDGAGSGGRIALRGTSTSAGAGIGEIFAYWNTNKVAGIIALAGSDTSNKDDGHLTFYTSASGPAVAERLRIDSSGRTLINTTAVTNTNDALTVKRASGSFTEMSMTLDASTAVGSYCNAFVYTKSKGSYWNGYGFQSSHGYIGGLVGKRDVAGGDADQEIRIEIGGTNINQSQEKTWNFKNNGDLSISDGNLVVAGGHGIDFSAQTQSSATTGSELLDHYEEGSFTPYIDREYGNSPIIGYTAQDGYYTRIGRVVHFYIEIRIQTYNGNGSYGTTFLRGLPFNAAARTGGRGGWDSVTVHTYNTDVTTTDGEVNIGVVGANTEQVELYIMRSEQNWADIPAPDANDQYKVGGYYFV